jgi:hypothetical protein
MAPIQYTANTPGIIGTPTIDAENFIATAFMERRGVECEALQTVAPLQGDDSAFGVINATATALPTAFAGGSGSKAPKAKAKK